VCQSFECFWSSYEIIGIDEEVEVLDVIVDEHRMVSFDDGLLDYLVHSFGLVYLSKDV